MLLMPVLIHPDALNHFYTANQLRTMDDRQLTGYLASEGGASCSGAVCSGGRSKGDAPRLRPLFQAALEGCSQKSSHAGSSGDGPSICSSTRAWVTQCASHARLPWKHPAPGRPLSQAAG